MTLVQTVQAVLTLYQRTLSPDHGPLRRGGACRYEPTCSAYLRQALAVHGAAGFLLGARRLLRCHPFTRGGHDPVPPAVPRAL